MYSAPQSDATTFAFASLSILLQWGLEHKNCASDRAKNWAYSQFNVKSSCRKIKFAFFKNLFVIRLFFLLHKSTSLCGFHTKNICSISFTFSTINLSLTLAFSRISISLSFAFFWVYIVFFLQNLYLTLFLYNLSFTIFF